MSFLIRSAQSSDENTNGHKDPQDHRERGHHTSSGSSAHESTATLRAVHSSSSSLLKFYPECCYDLCNCLRKPKDGEGRWVKFRKQIAHCPPSGPLARFICFFLIFALAWLNLWFLLGHVADFNGPIFALFFLEFSGLILGMCIKRAHLPALLGPLIFGVILQNGFCVTNIFRNFEGDYRSNCSNDSRSAHVLAQAEHYATEWIKPIREIALSIILTRAGLELSPKQLKKLSVAVPLLAMTPCITEALMCALLFYLFFTSNFMLCLVAGFALSAVSPAVVVPGMLSLSRRGYGVEQGVPTLLIAASSIDDVLAISLFTVFLNMVVLAAERDNGKLTLNSTMSTPSSTLLTYFTGSESPGRNDTEFNVTTMGTSAILSSMSTTLGSTLDFGSTTVPPIETSSSALMMYLSGPLSILVGVLFGIGVGMILHFLPAKDMTSKASFRLCILLFINIATILGFGHIPLLEGAGSLGVLVTSFIASFGWRSQPGWKLPLERVERGLALIWTIAVPLLFGTIGKEIKLTTSKGNEDMGYVFAVIFICLAVRSVVTYLVACVSAKVGWRERLFIAMAWIPKATVQAALAPLCLSKLETLPMDNPHREQLVHNAHNIVNMAVFAVLMTAPLGAVLISLTGPRLLKRVWLIQDEFPNGDSEEDASQTFKPKKKFINPSGSVFNESLDSRLDSQSTLPVKESKESIEKTPSSESRDKSIA